MAGTLTLVCTPIGNLGDLSPRAAEALAAADFWIVEDSRVSGKLLMHLALRKPMKVLNEHTSPSQMESFLGEILSGKNAVVVTDGGAPGVSDPGAAICDRAYELGIAVDAVPGPSAVIQALMLSGFFAQRFAFLGFLPRKPGPIRELLLPFHDSPMTIVCFESPFRVKALLGVAAEALGPRRYALCREMTKLHQQVFRSALPQLPEEVEFRAKGEVTVVFEGVRRGLLERD